MLRLVALLFWATPVVLFVCLLSILVGNAVFGLFKLLGLQLSLRCLEGLRRLHALVVLGGTAGAVAVWVANCVDSDASVVFLVEAALHGRCLPVSTLCSLTLLATLFVDRAIAAFLQLPMPALGQRIARAALVGQAFMALAAEDATVGLPLAVLALSRAADVTAPFAPTCARRWRIATMALAVALSVFVLAEGPRVGASARKTAAITITSVILC
jgi:hypothetical protein